MKTVGFVMGILWVLVLAFGSPALASITFEIGNTANGPSIESFGLFFDVDPPDGLKSARTSDELANWSIGIPQNDPGTIQGNALDPAFPMGDGVIFKLNFTEFPTSLKFDALPWIFEDGAGKKVTVISSTHSAGSTISENDTVKFEVVPIPGAVWLLASGLIGLVGLRRKFRKKD